MSYRRSQHRQVPVERRHRSSHSVPYHSLVETYSKEVTTRPLVRDDCEIYEEPMHEKYCDYPIVKVNTPTRNYHHHHQQHHQEVIGFDEVQSYRQHTKNVPVCNVIPPTPKIDEPKVTACKRPSTIAEKCVRSDSKESRYVYTHDVFIDPQNGRPYTPGRHETIDSKNCHKLKINVYFKPPQLPVSPMYTLDEVEIEKPLECPPEPRPISRGTVNTTSLKSDVFDLKNDRRTPSRSTILRRTSEVGYAPLPNPCDYTSIRSDSRISHKTPTRDLPLIDDMCKTDEKKASSMERCRTTEKIIPITVSESSKSCEQIRHKTPSPDCKPRAPSVQKAKERCPPTEEVIHIRERYERDETIRRFYPTTTSV
ncbi:unnamed protein product [Caenorhabditis bovis]|uniref:Uncharacterized protein n=1 Tax=Caenorhabditis bovis TaxID=2654633 RepID=A0A8S1EZD4_9PELO|nr:unnamed protein product [Caenorhabditis bovis]